ncbi:MAG: DUF4231 domain-containing protein [Anaerolineales bacterium]|nr:MAG: DUF4231 domain-containing protein [Anaerolineales bacterium]
MKSDNVNLTRSDQDKSNSNLLYVWGKYREYALTSRKRKAELTAWRYRVLIFGIVGAILGTFCQESIRLGLDNINNLKWVPLILGFSSAITIGLATYFGKEIVNPDQEKSWIRSRSTAEALKSEIFQFLANVPPYDTNKKSEKLLENVEGMLEEVEDLPTETISKEQKRKGLMTEDLTVEKYIQNRVNDQINNYYTPRADELKQKMEQHKKIGLSLGIIAIFFGAASSTGWTAGWIAVISTIAASITAFVYAGRYQYLIISYQKTGDRLERLRSSWESRGKTETDTDERNEFIRECERMISIENSGWMAEMIK